MPDSVTLAIPQGHRKSLTKAYNINTDSFQSDVSRKSHQSRHSSQSKNSRSRAGDKVSVFTRPKSSRSKSKFQESVSASSSSEESKSRTSTSSSEEEDEEESKEIKPQITVSQIAGVDSQAKLSRGSQSRKAPTPPRRRRSSAMLKDTVSRVFSVF